ncbi:BMP family ABC transporter substrate-binding protein [Salinibacillus xinjiangensis]|uniref:BMP family ABC transporter substrate-binding protein n=2 Tax=Salinibacillus xinjiangensis TaxID=1229268 RepID=A0A6G1X830_9BACI|nr:BMP family ABC transporter substrate-binding protein [Salinibacillus xinjiangensis]
MFIITLFITGCSDSIESNEVKNVGMLVEGTIYDQTWGKKGYMGLLEIKEEMDANVFFKEGVNSQVAVNEAVESFANKGVTLIFGHGSTYGRYFSSIRKEYPEIQFVYFNGDKYGENLTSLNFNANAMGFFAGMVASSMTETNQVGVVGAFEWQPEIDGFYEGVKYENPDVDVTIRTVNHWDNEQMALKTYKTMVEEKNIDIVYPAGDGFSVPIIEQAKEDGLYSIGYVSDLHDLGESTVLTSTVQHVDRLYLLAAQLFNKGKLTSGIMSFDFQDGVVSMGTFSDEVPESVQNRINEAVDHYIETGKLPNQVTN